MLVKHEKSYGRRNMMKSDDESYDAWPKLEEIRRDLQVDEDGRRELPERAMEMLPGPLQTLHGTGSRT